MVSTSVSFFTMFNSMINSIMGSPQVNDVASNIVIATSNTTEIQRPTSNSTTYFENLNASSSSPDIAKNISPSFSPVKTSRQNSMSMNSESVDNVSFSMSLKHNSDAIDLDTTSNQKFAIQYLLDKVRDNEKLLIAVAKENRVLSDEVSKLYLSNDVLAAENVTLKEVLSIHEQLHKKFVCTSDVDNLRESFNQFMEEKLSKDSNLTEELFEMREQIDDLKTTCQLGKDEICVAMVQDFETLDDMMKSIKEKVNTNIQIAMEEESTNQLQAFQAELNVLKDQASHTKVLLETIKADIVNEKDSTSKRFKKVEREIAVTNQYNRRENMVIEGIPDKVPQHKLEETCLDIIHKLGFNNVGYYEVVGCHRLRKNKGDTTAPTIIRFINRKIPEYCKKNRWRLRNMNYNNWFLNIRDDLYEANDVILKECEKLKKDGKLQKVFTYNGFVKVVKKNGDWPLKLTHIDDVHDLFS